MLLCVVAKLELSGFLLLLPGSSRITRGANAVELLSNGGTNRCTKVETHPSADVAIRFAISEYLHVDCRLIHARQ
jgi:hypothetical protein